MITLLTVVHILICLFLIVIVLLQHGKGASMGAAFGGSSQTVFGTEGPLPLLNKITTWAAVFFMVTSISLAYMSSRTGDGSVMKEVVAPVAEPHNAPIPLPAADGAAPQVPAQGK
jgi:preprotein translocase subunit SecG